MAMFYLWYIAIKILRGSYSYANGTSTYLSNDVANWFRDQVEKYPDTKWRIAAVHKNLFTGSGHQTDEDGALFRNPPYCLYFKN